MGNRRLSTAGKKRSRGQSLVEMAIVAPILIVVLAAIIDMGRAIDVFISITNAAREGARYGSLHPTDPSTIALRTLNEANGSGVIITGTTLTPANVSVTFPAGGAYVGNPVRVTVSVDMPLYFGGLIGLSTLRLNKEAEMVIMYSPVTPPLGN
jgi:Flp pilus assembly protein TadG